MKTPTICVRLQREDLRKLQALMGHKKRDRSETIRVIIRDAHETMCEAGHCAECGGDNMPDDPDSGLCVECIHAHLETAGEGDR